MKIQGRHFRTLWEDPEQPEQILIIDQRDLPHALVVEKLFGVSDFIRAIQDMHVRGAPLIGATGAYGMVAACREAETCADPLRALEAAAESLRHTRPTAIDLLHGIERVKAAALSADPDQRVEQARQAARALVEESVNQCAAIGEHGLPLIEAISRKKKGRPVNILTHCNAGWLACLDHGTATSPIYRAHDRGIPVHVWVDETRPRNQGARITAFELLEHGVPHTVITDNLGGHLMQRGQVDMVIVGTDRTARNGDVANKIGTYLKALAARDNGLPFYVALPGSSIDWTITDGLRDIPIEERGEDEVKQIRGKAEDRIVEVLLTPEGSPALNYGFDVTPARLVTGLITERGICQASEAGLLSLYPEQAARR